MEYSGMRRMVAFAPNEEARLDGLRDIPDDATVFAVPPSLDKEYSPESRGELLNAIRAQNNPMKRAALEDAYRQNFGEPSGASEVTSAAPAFDLGSLYKAGGISQQARAATKSAVGFQYDLNALSKAGIGDVATAEKPAPSGFVGRLKDTGIDLAKGVVSTGESLVGLGSIATGGLVGKGMAAIGYDPKQTQEWLAGFQSDARQQEEQDIQAADGFWDTLTAIGVRPGALVGRIVQSIPGTVGAGAVGGAVARRIAATAAAEAKAAGMVGDLAAEHIATRVAEQSGKIVAAASGAEGAQAAGSIAEAGRQAGSDWTTYAPAALAGGAGTAVIGFGSGKLATSALGKRLGMGDIETDIAMRGIGSNAAQSAAGMARRVPMEAAKEGLLEEMPQSTQEKAFENIATGRPWDEHLGKAAAEGLIAGAGMGGGHALISGRRPDVPVGETFAGRPISGYTTEQLFSLTTSPAVSDAAKAKLEAELLRRESADTYQPSNVDIQFQPGTTGTPESSAAMAEQIAANNARRQEQIDTIGFEEQQAEQNRQRQAIIDATPETQRFIPANRLLPAPSGVDFISGQQGTGTPAQWQNAGLDQRATERQQTIANGVLAHHSRPSPELLMRLMRVDQTMATMLFNHWKANGLQNQGQEAAQEVSSKFDPQGLQPGTPEYEAAFDSWAAGQQESKRSASLEQRRVDGQAAVDKKNGWRKRLVSWFETAKDGDTITTDIEGEEYLVVEKTIKRNGKEIVSKRLVLVGNDVSNDQTIIEYRDGKAYTGPNTSQGIDEFAGWAQAPETDIDSRAASLGKLLEEGIAKVGAGGTALDAAAHQAATSPLNDLPHPTDAQKEAGNYTKGHVRFQGMDISIENPAGSVRSGKDEDGKAWENTLQHHYGYIKGTIGRDKDHLDVFIKPGAQSARTAYVVDQINPKTGKFDEHKIVLGADSEADARAIYQANYAEGWKGLGEITAMPIEQFKDWIKSGKTKKPVAYTEPKGVSHEKPVPKAKAPAAIDPSAPYGKVGVAPFSSQVVGLKDNGDGTATVMRGEEPFYDFENGDPVTVPTGATAGQIRQAVTDAGALSSRDKWFGVAKAETKPAETGTTPAGSGTEQAKPEAIAGKPVSDMPAEQLQKIASGESKTFGSAAVEKASAELARRDEADSPPAAKPAPAEPGVSTAEQVATAQELLAGVPSGEHVSEEDRKAAEQALGIYSLNALADHELRRMLFVLEVNKANTAKVMAMSPRPRSINDIADALGALAGAAAKKAEYERAFKRAADLAPTDEAVANALNVYTVEKLQLESIANERGMYGVKWAERNIGQRWTTQSIKVRKAKDRVVAAVEKASAELARRDEADSPKATKEPWQYGELEYGDKYIDEVVLPDLRKQLANAHGGKFQEYPSKAAAVRGLKERIDTLENHRDAKARKYYASLDNHYGAVRAALADGKPVPPVAYESYDDLKGDVSAGRIKGDGQEVARVETPQHIESGRAEPATAPVIAASIKESAKNTPMNIEQAREWLLSEIDKAIIDAKSAKEEGIWNRADDKVNLEGIMDVGATIGFKTFDVPGDGKFRVLNLKESLQKFKKQVAASPGFKKNATRPMSLASGNGGKTSVRDLLDDGEYVLAADYGHLTGDPLLFGAAIGRNDHPVAYTNAEPVDIKGVDAQVGREWNQTGKSFLWRVIETTTGAMISSGTTKERAISKVLAKLDEHGVKKLIDIIKETPKVSQAELERQFTDWGSEEEAKAQKTRDAVERADAEDRALWNSIWPLDDGEKRSPNPWNDINSVQVVVLAKDAAKAGKGDEFVSLIERRRGGTNNMLALAARKALAEGNKPGKQSGGVDYKGFERTPTGNGNFTLKDGNLLVKVEAMGGGKFQASHGSAKSSPHINSEQGAVDWAANLRDASKKITAYPFYSNNKLFNAEGTAELPKDWTGVARSDSGKRFFYLGQENGERSFNPLKAENYEDALKEADGLKNDNPVVPEGYREVARGYFGGTIEKPIYAPFAEGDRVRFIGGHAGNIQSFIGGPVTTGAIIKYDNGLTGRAEWRDVEAVKKPAAAQPEPQAQPNPIADAADAMIKAAEAMKAAVAQAEPKKLSSEEWRNEGMTPEQIMRRKADGYVEELAGQIQEESAEPDFDPKEVVAAVKQWADDTKIPEDVMRKALHDAVEKRPNFRRKAGVLAALKAAPEAGTPAATKEQSAKFKDALDAEHENGVATGNAAVVRSKQDLETEHGISLTNAQVDELNSAYQAGVAVSDEIEGKEPATKDPWQMTSAEFGQAALEASEYRTQYERKPEFKAEFLADQVNEWRRVVEKAGESHVIPDNVLDDYVAQFGESTLASMFRGVSEKGVSQWEPAKTRIWDKTYKQFLADHSGAILHGNKKDVHRSAIRRALAQGKPVPANVLADYPDLATKEPAQGAEKVGDYKIGGYPVSGLGDKALKTVIDKSSNEADKAAASAELERRKVGAGDTAPAASIAGKPVSEMSDGMLNQIAKSSQPAAEKAKAEVERRSRGNESVQDDSFLAKPEELDADKIKAGYAHRSHSLSGKVEMERKWYVDAIQTFYDSLLPLARNDAQKAKLEQLTRAFRDEYRDRRYRVLDIGSSTYSAAIAGPSNFNSKQSERRFSSLDKAEKAFNDWASTQDDVAKPAILALRTADEKSGDDNAAEAARVKKLVRPVLEDLAMIGAIDTGKAPGMDRSAFVNGAQRKISNLSDAGEAEALRKVFAQVAQWDSSHDKPLFTAKNSVWQFKPAEESTAVESPAPTQSPSPTDRAKDDAQDQARRENPNIKTTLAEHDATMDRLRDGTATLAEYKAAFQRLQNSTEELTAEFAAMKKDDILKHMGGMAASRYRSDTKAQVVTMAVRDLMDDFSIGRGISYSMGGRDAYANAVRAQVERTTDADLAEYAEHVKSMRAERAERVAQMTGAMKDPKTLADFKMYLDIKAGGTMTREQARMTLTPAQRVAFDELAAEQSREERKARGDQQRADIRVAATTTDGQVIETKHTKTGEPLFVVKAAERVERDVYNHWNATAKKLGGWYSSYRAAGAVPGFQFKTRENADAFLAFIGGNVEQAKEAVQTRRDAFEDDRSQTAVERLTEMADRLEERADESLNRDRKENTDRRARMAASAEAAANSDKSLAKTMRNIAQAIESGKTKFLDRVRQKAQVEMLRGFLHTAKANELRAKFPSYADQEKHRGAAPTAETADYVDFPRYTAFRSDLATMGRQMLDIDGAKKVGAALLKVADDVSAAYLAFAKEHLHQVSTFKTSAGKGAIFASRDDAETAIKRSGFKGKAVVLPFKRGQNIIIMSPSAAKEAGIWQGDDDKRITLTPDFGEEVVAKVKEFSSHRISMPYLFESVRAERARLKSIGIETAAELRAALREFMDLRAAPPEVDKVKQMERAMIGRKNDGLDFFPTPASVADELVQAAGIEEGMAVLEPSAGMGHIAERIRAAGVDPDVVEMASDRRELLEAKGFRLVGSDFMDMTPRDFTYGDVFRAPDGTLGVMRGSGGMGSNRVGLDPLDANGNPEPRRMGWYDRDELTGVKKRAGNSGYDRIIMNPPFSDRRDAEHVQHAYTLLKPGGRLVAIMGEGVFFGQDKKAQAFRDWLEEVGGTSEKLEEGTFLDPSLPVNTGVNARMVVITKQADSGVAMFNAKSGSRGNPIDAAALEATIARVIAGSPSHFSRDTVVTAPLFSDLPAPILAKAKKEGYDANGRKPNGEKLTGATYDGKVYLVQENISSELEAEETLLHERIHQIVHGNAKDPDGIALRQSLGRLYLRLGAKSGIEHMAKEAGIDITGPLAAFPNVAAANRTAFLAEEFLAHAEGQRAYEKLPAKIKRAIREFYGEFRDWLRGSRFVRIAEALGARLGDFTQADLAWTLKGIRQQEAGTGSKAIRFMTAWHGSPHDHDGFDSSKIGTGEGAQAYGWGHYFAGAREVAEYYKEYLSANNGDFRPAFFVDGKEVPATPAIRAVASYVTPARSVADARVVAARMAPEHAAEIAKVPDTLEVKNKSGRLYQVELAPTEDELLDWDKPLSEQSEKVKAALGKVIERLRGMDEGSHQWKMSYRMVASPEMIEGRQAYKLLAALNDDKDSIDPNGDKAASEYLLSLGIRGIKYLDGSSRNRPLKEIKAEFLAELPEDADTAEVMELVGTGRFSPKNEALIKALADDDWLGFDYPAQAISAALGNSLSNYDASPALLKAVSDAKDGGTHNYVIFSDADVKITAKESRGTAQGGAASPSVKAIQDVVSRFKSEFKGAAALDIRVVGSASEIPARYRPSPYAEGVFHDDAGLIYLVAGNLRTDDGRVNTSRAFQVLMHEAVGHYGLAAMMGERFSRITARVKEAARAKGEVNDDIYQPGHPDYATVEAVRLRYPDATENEIAQEVLARMAETDPGRTLFGYVRAVVRQWLRDMARAAGFTIDVTTAELNDLVAQASRYMRRGDGLAQGVDVDALGVADMAVGGMASKGAAPSAPTFKAVDTESAEFKKWFGNSRVVDAGGKPLVVYHGTSADIQEFDPSLTEVVEGVFLTPSKETASMYSDKYGSQAQGANVMPLYVSMKNPRVIDVSKGDYYNLTNLTAALSDGKHDGVLVYGPDGKLQALVAKDAAQIKSAISNTGAFSDKNPSILESRRAPGAAKPKEPRTGILDTILRKAGGELAAKITGPAYDKLTAYLGGKVPEGIKAGMVSDYGLDESYIDRRTGMQTEQQKAARQTKTFVEGLMELDRAQSRVAYQWLNNRGAEADRLMAQLPPESQQVLKDIKIQIAKLTIEAVRLGQLDAETAERNFLAYLHRSYAKYDLNTDDKTWKAERAKAIKILGDQYKGRGLKMDVDPDRIHSAPGWWQGEMKGKRVKVLKNEAGRFAFVADGTAIPSNLSGYKLEGVWEIRARKADNRITLWRDFTQDERTMMGELDEAKYAVARTLFMMNRDIEVGRFHEWVADEYAKTPEEAEEEGLQMADASDSMMRAFTPDEWVTVPTSKIPGTGVFKFGALAGMVVPGPVWNDIRQISAGRFEPFGAAYASILRAWKLSKTALTPTTHVNNIMGNFVMADMHDVGARDAIAAVRLMVAAANGDKDAKAMLDRFEDSGATQGMFTTHELKKEVLEPLLQQLREEVGMADDEAAILKASAIMSLALHGQFGEAWAGAKAAAKQSTAGRVTGAVVTKAQDYYQAEDSVFRLAAFLKSIDEGKTDREAGKLARKAFLDYHINAPWINAMRGTAMPFIAFAYRAIPMLAETAARKPWKIAKYMLVAGGLNALAYAMLGADADEDKERAYLPEEKAGRLWGIVPKLIRMPWNRESKLRDGKTTSDPVFLDVRRWIPVGDVVDYGQDKSALPLIPQPLMPGGPLIIAAEFLVNKSAFTGKELTKETDTWVEKAAKVGGHFYKGFAPNVPIPYSGTWAGTKIDNAVKGKEDPLGRAYPVPEAIASGFGLKLERYPVDTLQRNAVLDMKGKLRELSDEQRQAARDYGRQGMTKVELDEKVGEIVGKKNAAVEEYKAKERKAMGRTAP